MRFIKKNIFMIVFFLFVAPLASYIGYNTIYKPYGGDIASLFKVDKTMPKTSEQLVEEPSKEEKESDVVLTNKKQEDDFPKITKETVEQVPSVPEKNVENDKSFLGETDIFANLDSDIKNSDTSQNDKKTDTKTDPNIASDDIFQDILNDSQASSQIQKDFNIDIPEDSSNNKKQADSMSSDTQKDDKKLDNTQADLTPVPSENLLDEKFVSDVTKELESKNEDLDSKSISNVLDDKENSEIEKELENKKSDSVPPVLGNDMINDTVIPKMNAQLEEKEKGQTTLKPTDNILGEEAKIDLDSKEIDSKDIIGESKDNNADILPKAEDNVLGEQSEKNDMTPSFEDKQSEAQKKALEELGIAEDLFPMSPSPKFQGITPDAPDDATLVQDKLSAQNIVKTSTDNKGVQNDKSSTQDKASTKDDTKNSADNKQSQTQESNINSQSIKSGVAECAYEHHIDSKAMKETFRLTISLKRNEQPLTMEVSRQLNLLDYVTMTTDDIDEYPDSFTQLSVFCKEMSVRKILTEGYSNISSPVSASSVPSP